MILRHTNHFNLPIVSYEESNSRNACLSLTLLPTFRRWRYVLNSSLPKIIINIQSFVNETTSGFLKVETITGVRIPG
jgi:hypothetical protein